MSVDVFVGIDGTTPDPKYNARFEDWDMNYSFIYMMYNQSSASDSNKIFIPGPDLYGVGTTLCIQQALTFLKPRVFKPANISSGWQAPRVIVAGYSRGAYAALRVAQALGLAGVKVAFAGFLDIVKCTDDGTEAKITQAIRDFLNEPSAFQNLPRPKGPYDSNYQSAVYAAADKEEKRKQQIYAGVNDSPLPNMISFGVGAFSIPSNILSGFHARRNKSVGSWTHPMGHYPIENAQNIVERKDFWCTHSAMGGMPFRGDRPVTISRKSEWQWSGEVAKFIVKHGTGHAIFKTGSPPHPLLQTPEPPASWYMDQHIRDQYRLFFRENGGLDGCGLDPGFENTLVEDKAKAQIAVQSAMARHRH